MNANGNDVILQMKDVRKSFGATVALDDVNFELWSKEIHGLLGGNGAGKTTLMNVLFGLYREDSGQILLHGHPARIQSPRDAIQHRIGMVHQHFLQIPNFTVIQNIVLGTEVQHNWTLNLDQEETKVRELAGRFGLDIDPQALMEDLPMGTRQKVEILKALYRGVEILILDEPTTNLTPQEVDDLFQSLRVMVDADLSIVFITHKLREVLSVCDRISVLRDGQNVLTLDRTQSSEEELVKAMVGDDVDIADSIIFSGYDSGPGTSRSEDKPILEVKDLEVTTSDNITLLKSTSFQLFEGEILGVAGVAGNGQRELAEVLMGIQSPSKGRFLLDGTDATKLGTRKLLEKGVAYIPEDRLHDGFLPKANVAQNLILGYQQEEPYSHRGFIDWKTVFRMSKALILEYDIKTSGPSEAGGVLSGGNIQRVMIARAFSRPSRLLVAHNPTRGLDIPSMDFVYTKMLDRKKDEAATLLFSENLDELMLLCDRMAVLYRGEVVGILDRDQFEKYGIGRLMSGIRTDA